MGSGSEAGVGSVACFGRVRRCGVPDERLERLPQSTANLAGCDKGFYLYPENSGKPLGHPKREVV